MGVRLGRAAQFRACPSSSKSWSFFFEGVEEEESLVEGVEESSLGGGVAVVVMEGRMAFWGEVVDRFRFEI
jgi:hypothetical protein